MTSKSRFFSGGADALRDAVIGASQVVEGVHQAVLGTVGKAAPVPMPVPLITRLVYQSIRGVADAVGQGADIALRLAREIAPEGVGVDAPLEPWQLYLLSGCNAAFGDYFAEKNSDWALPMTFCRHGRPLDLSSDNLHQALDNPHPHLILFVHGLGMNELYWQDPQGWSFAGQLEQDRNCTTLALRYNSGLHIFENGLLLAESLEQLVATYPIPIERITLIGHSMGGLVCRSASHYASRLGLRWREKLQDLACFGSPHQGAPLENLGNWVSYALGATPYTAPLSLLAKRRSAGIKDLRHGCLRHEDWEDRDPDSTVTFTPHRIPMSPELRYLLVASTLGESRSAALMNGLGDGLVGVRSALNLGSEEGLPGIDSAADSLVTRTLLTQLNHVKMPTDRRVFEALVEWL